MLLIELYKSLKTLHFYRIFDSVTLVFSHMCYLLIKIEHTIMKMVYIDKREYNYYFTWIKY